MGSTRKFIKWSNGYSDRIFDDYDFDGIHRDLVAATKNGVDYDTLVGTGMSGTLVVPFLALKLDLYWLVVRKNGESSHGSQEVAGRLGRRWLFVDDFISTGKTYARVRAVIATYVKEWNSYGTNPFETTCVGSFEYQKPYVGITPYVVKCSDDRPR